MQTKRMRVVAAFFATLLIITSAQANAACRPADPLRTVTAEVGESTDAVTGNRGAWSEEYVTLASRDGPAHASYATLSNDRRFGQSDTTYEGGTYFLIAPKLMLEAIASFSPTHRVLPESTLHVGFDLRGARGYGYQVAFTERTYPNAAATIVSGGADRYVGNRHFSVTATAVQLSNVPGTAISGAAAYAQTLQCDDLTFALSGGRDVENTGVGSRVAVYQVISYSARDVHWFNSRLGLSLGTGWYLLTGAYDRFEVRLALHARI